MKTVCSSHTHHTQLPLLLASYFKMVHLLQLMKGYWYIIVNWSQYVTQMSLVFAKYFFSVPGSHPGHHIALGGQVSLGSSWLWVSQTFFVFEDQFWRGLVRGFVECPLIGFYLMFVSWLDWGYRFRGRKPQRKSVILSCTVKCMYHSSPHSVLFERKSLFVAPT